METGLIEGFTAAAASRRTGTGLWNGWQFAARKGQPSRHAKATIAPRPAPNSGTVGVLVCLLLGFGLAPPAAAQVAVGGVMRFATPEVAFNGGFGGATVDVWLLEPYGYLSYDAGVWAIQAGVATPVVRREIVRVSLRVGTSTAVAGPAVEPDVHPTVGAGVRIGRRFGILAEVDRAKAFTLWRGGLFVDW